MAVISIDLGTATQTARQVEAACVTYGYAGDGSNASRLEFTRKVGVRFYKELTRAYEIQRDAQAAGAAAAAKVDSEVNPT